MATDDFNPYEERQRRRRERLEELAEKARRESAAAFERSRAMASVIPFGQPILVGHHSEGRDRRYRERIWNTQGKSVQLAKKADYYEEKAAAVGSGGISSDDPQAIDKLTGELAKLETLQQTMKKANACVRRNDRAGLAALGFSESRIASLFEPDFAGRIGFADYELKNNGANIRRIQGRIAELQRRPTESTEREANGVTIREDAAEGRVMLIFPGKPPESTRQVLKSAGFKWSPTRGAWVRHLNNAGRVAAQYVMEKIGGAA